MKQIYFLTTVLFLSCIKLIAQTTDVVTGLDSPDGILLHGNDLYYTQDDKISKIDITETTLTPVEIVDGLNNHSANMVLIGNDLYIAQGSKISKIDITATTPTTTEVINGLNGAYGMALHGNDLYITQGDKISKIGITATPTMVTEVITVRSILSGMVFHGNDLYITQADRISKIDITATTLTAIDIISVSDFVTEMVFYGNDLYFSQGSKISKIDITSTTPYTATDVVSGLDEPLGLAINENDLYIVESDENKISKFNLGTLSIGEDTVSSNVKLYPNPSPGFIQISGLTKTENYAIYNMLGVKINSGTIAINEKIRTEKLSKGPYFLTIEKGHTFKFIKD